MHPKILMKVGDAGKVSYGKRGSQPLGNFGFILAKVTTFGDHF